MEQTPRTDAEARIMCSYCDPGESHNGYYVTAELARSLERELSEVTRERNNLRGEAGEKYVPAYDNALNAFCSALEYSMLHEGPTNPVVIGYYGDRLRAERNHYLQFIEREKDAMAAAERELEALRGNFANAEELLILVSRGEADFSAIDAFLTPPEK